MQTWESERGGTLSWLCRSVVKWPLSKALNLCGSSHTALKPSLEDCGFTGQLLGGSKHVCDIIATKLQREPVARDGVFSLLLLLLLQNFSDSKQMSTFPGQTFRAHLLSVGSLQAIEASHLAVTDVLFEMHADAPPTLLPPSL